MKLRVIAATSLLVLLGACAAGPFERAGRNADNTIDNVRDGVGDVVDDVRDTAKDVRDDVKRKR